MALKPHRSEGTMAFMVESCWPFRPTRFAMESDALQGDYDEAWGGFPKAKLPNPYSDFQSDCIIRRLGNRGKTTTWSGRTDATRSQTALGRFVQHLADLE